MRRIAKARNQATHCLCRLYWDRSLTGHFNVRSLVFLTLYHNKGGYRKSDAAPLTVNRNETKRIRDLHMWRRRKGSVGIKLWRSQLYHTLGFRRTIYLYPYVIKYSSEISASKNTSMYLTLPSRLPERVCGLWNKLLNEVDVVLWKHELLTYIYTLTCV